MTLEREIYSIETANINKETLDAMSNAGKAMKQIHAGLTIDKVDNVMYVYYRRKARAALHLPRVLLKRPHREDLREQHAIGEEISEAITSGVTTGGIDEDELDEELAELQQKPEVVDVLLGAPRGHLLALGHDRRQLQRLEVVLQEHRTLGLELLHGVTPVVRLA